MKKFILKLIKFALFPILLFFIMDTLINFTANEKALNSSIKAKILKLPINKDEINIIIAGDSRAERQLIPQIIELKTGFNTINIAVSNGDLVSTVSAIKENFSASNFIFVISASSWQINDGAIDSGYLSEKCFQEATVYEKYILYKNNIVGFTKMYGRLIKQAIISISQSNYSYDENIINHKGFLGIIGNLEALNSNSEINTYINRHKFYKNLSNNCIRWKIFKESIRELSNLKSFSFVIQPPMSPYGKKITKNSIIQKAESEYSQKITDLALEFKNIEFYDFYSQNSLSLNDSLYYDYYHLNINGARIYSEKMADLINEKLNSKNAVKYVKK